MSLDPVAKALSAVKRDLRKTINTLDNPGDQHMILDVAQREIDKIRAEIPEGK